MSYSRGVQGRPAARRGAVGGAVSTADEIAARIRAAEMARRSGAGLEAVRGEYAYRFLAAPGEHEGVCVGCGGPAVARLVVVARPADDGMFAPREMQSDLDRNPLAPAGIAVPVCARHRRRSYLPSRAFLAIYDHLFDLRYEVGRAPKRLMAGLAALHLAEVVDAVHGCPYCRCGTEGVKDARAASER